MCLWRNSSYEFDTFAPSIFHKLAIIELPIHLIAGYVIIFKTPPRMESVKGMMLLMHLCGAYLDLFLSALSTQYMIFPVAAGYPNGLYSYFGMPTSWQGYMYVSGICLAGVSILGFFENRFVAVVQGRKSYILKERKRLAYIIGNFIFSFVYILPVTLNPPDQNYGKEFARQILPCIPKQIIEHPNFYVYAIDPTLLTGIISFGASQTTVQCIYFFTRIIIYLSSKKAKSQKTYKLQLHFFIALSVQILIPLVVIIGPVCFIVLTFMTSHYDQIMNNIFLNIIAIHGLLSSTVMLAIHRPYRETVLNMFFYSKIKRKTRRSNLVNNNVSVMIVSSSRA